MSRYTEAVCKLCRRESQKLYLKGDKCFTKCTLEKRPTPPDSTAGRDGRANTALSFVRSRRPDVLRVGERQFRNYYGRASESAAKRARPS
jgi:small subunit ribosomal protein S4